MSSSQHFYKGMNQDVDNRFQPTGTYRYLNNGQLLAENNISSITNDLGNQPCLEFPNDQKIIGHVLTNTDDIIVFSTNDVINHEIGIFNPNSCTYKRLVNAPCLNFSTQYPVFPLFRIRKGCERVVYFTDRNNNYRTINLDTPSIYRDDGGDFDCELFQLSRNYQVPTLTDITVNDSGGQLDLGSIQFAIRYLDRDFNPTNWILVSNHVNIYDDSISANYGTINGGINIPETGDTVLGSVPQTNKSVSILFDEIDTSFSYYQIAALHGTSGSGVISEVWISPEQFITQDSVTFLYSGHSVSGGYTQIPLSEISVDLDPIEVVHDHVQKDNVLWLANLKSATRDWSKYQSVASAITVNYSLKTDVFNNTSSDLDPKNPVVNVENKSMPGDEIVSLAIQFLDKNGWSPAFHIPGRPATAFDLQELTAVTTTTPSITEVNIADVQHLGVNFNDKVERWKVFNTASSPIDGKGTLGYHQTNNSVYPDIRDCDGFSIWGKDSGDNSLVGTPIRHHRIPSRRIVPNKSGGVLNIIGLEFDNIEYPNSNIIGHRFLMGKRDESNSTVIDQGLLFYNESWLDGNNVEIEKLSGSRITSNIPNSQSNGIQAVFISPKTLINPSSSNSDYFSINGIYLTSEIAISEAEDIVNVDGGGSNNDFELFGDVFNLELTDFTIIPDTFNRNTESNIIVSTRSSQSPILSFDKTIINNSYSNIINVHNINFPLSLTQDISGILDVTLKKVGDPYSSLESIVYKPIHTNYLTLTDSQQVIGGDVNISKMDYMDINKIELDSDIIIFGDPNDIDFEHFFGTFQDSTINYSLRHGGTDDCDSIYNYTGSQTLHIRRKAFTSDSNGSTYTIREEICPETYLYNFDYSNNTIAKPVFPLSGTFDYCSNCINTNPYRIRYSKQATQEEVEDNYRVFLPNNYRDLDGSTGDINALITDKDELYALTNTPWFIPTRPQTLQTTEDTIFIGTGDRLSIPPHKMITSYHMYGGTKFKESVVSTEFGTFYTDTDSGKVFKLSNSIEEISSNGLKEFFRNNLKLSLNEIFRAVGEIDYPIQTTTHTYGIGVRGAYDPIHQNYIIHKKDYDILDKDNFQIINNLSDPFSSNLIYVKSENQFYTNNGTVVPVTLDDVNYFRNNSFTISYSIPLKVWNSFHSYLPHYIFNNENTFYTSNNTSSIWTHNTDNYQNYYGKQYPFIIDLISVRSNNSSPIPTDSDKFFSNNYLLDILDSDSTLIRDEFFNNVIFYNTNQSSGLLDIIVKTNPFTTYSTTSAIAERVDNEWNLSHIRDLVVNRNVPIFSDDWINIQSQYPIDKVANPLATLPTKSLFEVERFRDHFLGQRYYYNGSNRLNFQFLLTNSKNTNR